MARELVAARTQDGPLPIAIEHHPSIVNRLEQQQRRAVHNAIEPRHVHLAAKDPLQTHCELDSSLRTIFGERHQKVKVRFRRLIAPSD